MCTAVNCRGGVHLFGRTLDYEKSYGEQVALTPRRYPLRFRHGPTAERHYALIGTATTAAEEPLYYDGMNEKGLCMAGLLFPRSGVYLPPAAGGLNVASFEMIPFVLGQCATVPQARALLQTVTVTDTVYSPTLPPTPLHWLVADETGAFVAEPTAEGLKLYDNPIEVLTNEPPFPFQLQRLQDYLPLSPAPPQNALCPTLPRANYSGGLGAFGLPGDLSSGSRFVRAAFHAHHAAPDEKAGAVQRFFHILDTVSVPKGSLQTAAGEKPYTLYAACCAPAARTYYVTTHTQRGITAYPMGEDIDGSSLSVYPFPAPDEI